MPGVRDGIRGIGLAALAALLLAGCLVDEGSEPENAPPRTYLSITGESLAVANYRTILDWNGTDRDGLVIGYAYRWDGPWQPEPEDSLWWEDPSWTFTSVTRDTFDVPIGGTYAERTFTIRAIDDDRLADPNPIQQRFRLANFAPQVEWTDSLRHPTHARPSLPAISFAWTPVDYDGRETIARAELWLDTAPGEDSSLTHVTVVDDTVGAFFPEHFQGRYGERTVHLQVFDRAATGSDTISWSWTVIPPQGDYLLIDNAWPEFTSPADNADRFWRERMENLFGGNVHIYDVETEGPFRSRQEVLPIFQLFRGVVWYGLKAYDLSGPMDAAMRLGLERAEEALWAYAEQGGAVLLTGHNLIGTAGGLSERFWHDRFGIEAVFTHYEIDRRISDFTLPRRSYVRGGPALGGYDSLRVLRPLTNTDCFRLGERTSPLLWLDPDTTGTTPFAAHAEEPLTLGALGGPQPGTIALITMVLTDFYTSSPSEEAVEALMETLFPSP